ncbi:N-terminal phage integrase SAM-like domain-containing protein, partial [Bifidobacterium longum]
MVRKPTRDTERIGRETCGFSEVEMLLQEFWDDRYVGYCERLREVTRVGYESAWRCHVEPVFGSMELADIGVDDIELWLSGFASPGAARKAWAVLRQMLRKAAKWGYLEVDVTRLEIDL